MMTEIIRELTAVKKPVKSPVRRYWPWPGESRHKEHRKHSQKPQKIIKHSMP